MNLLRNTISAGALAIALTAASQAHANLIVSVDSGGAQNFTLVGNGKLSVSTTTTDGNWDVNLILTGVDKSAPPQLMDVHNLDALNIGSSSTLTIVATETNLNLGTGGFSFQLSGGGSTSAIDSLTRTFYLNTNNSIGFSLSSIELGSTTSAAFPDTTSFQNVTGNFSLVEVITLSASTLNADLSSDDAVKVPEPGSLALLGAGLIGFGWFARRRRKSA